MEYPSCPKRVVGTVKGVVTHAKCLDQSNTRYMALVQPAECERCLTGGPEPAPAEPAPPKPPGLVRRAISYAEALAQWTAAGRPERSDKDVEHIFSRFCKCCRWYDRRKNICKGCGCRVADSGYAIRNKIKMATERCPKNLW
jgi:hypothetical protein